MCDFATALALVFVIEGIVLAALPEGMKRLMAQMIAMPAAQVRIGGLISAGLGVAAIWLIRR